MARTKSASAPKSKNQKTPEKTPTKVFHGPKKLPIAQSLLARAHSPDTAASIYLESAVRRPLYLHPTSKEDLSVNAREQRRRAREAKAATQRRLNRKPRPLSAVTKRKLGLYEVPKHQQKWEIFVPLHKLWTGYIRDVLGWSNNNARQAAGGMMQLPNVDARVVGPLIASADFHGALVEVVQCRCVGRVGIRGIVVKDTKETFEIITRKNELKIVPKEYTTFRVQIPLHEDGDMNGKDNFVAFELLGSQFAHRPAERATKKIKLHLPPDI